MTRLNLKVDEDTLLRTYQLSTLKPQQWEEVDHELVDQDVLPVGNHGDHQALHKVEVEDPLGLGGGINIKDLDVAKRPTLLITSKSFSPAQLLSYAYPDATYHDLVVGVENLEKSLEAREESVRMLVEDNLDSFVVVKSAVDSLDVVMKQEILAPETAHATQPLRIHLKCGAEKLNQMFLPVLETASKAQKLRTTLGIFQRSRFFFNLPSFIMESIDAGKYEFALRDYKKGKYLLENRPSQLLPIAAVDAPTRQFQQEQQRRILDKVWSNVEKAMDQMRNILVTRLQDPGRSVEDHEKTLETLMELHSTDESAWAYFDSQRTAILDKMRSTYRAGVDAIEISQRDSASLSALGPLDMSPERQLKVAVQLLEMKQADVILAKSTADSTWHALLCLAKSVSASITSTLPGFWRISKGFMGGKFVKRNDGTGLAEGARSPTECFTMASDIVNSYVSLISRAFILCDGKVASTASSNPATRIPSPLFPKNSHSLATAFHLQKILNEIEDCVAELGALNISDDVSIELKSLVDCLRRHFMHVLLEDWIRDAGLLYHLESWTAISGQSRSPSGTSARVPDTVSTHLLSQFQVFQRHVTTAMYSLASDSHPVPSDPTKQPAARKQTSTSLMNQELIREITHGFLEAVYHFWDGQMVLVSDEAPPPVFESSEGLLLARGTCTSLSEIMDINNPSIRLLIVTTNLDYFRKFMVPGMISELEGTFATVLAEERKVLESVIDELDKTLFEAYIRPRASKIKGLLCDAILGDQGCWSNTGQAVAIRQYVFEILNHLVDVHAQVCSVSPSLLDRTLNALIGGLVKEASECFETIRRFGTSGLLLAVLELTFIHKSLGYYGRDSSVGKALQDIYTKQIPKAYAPCTGDADFQASFAIMQKVLAEARRATDIQFLCFRKSTAKVKDESSTESSRRKDRNKQG